MLDDDSSKLTRRCSFFLRRSQDWETKPPRDDQRWAELDLEDVYIGFLGLLQPRFVSFRLLFVLSFNATLTFTPSFFPAVISFMLGQRSLAVFTEFVEKLQVAEPANLLRLAVVRSEASAFSLPPLFAKSSTDLSLPHRSRDLLC